MKDFGEKINTNKIPFNTEVDQDKYLEGFIEKFADDEEIRVHIYSEQLSEKVSFDVYLQKTLSGLRLDFKIRELVEEISQDRAFLLFDYQNNVYNLTHRVVKTKSEMGITGSEVLAKAENILEDLFNQDLIPDGPIVISTGQTSVIEWVQKNGYEFISQIDADKYQEVISNPEKYRTDVKINKTNDIPREDYIFSVEKLAKLPVDENGEINVNQLRNTLPLGERFTLFKKLNEK